MNEDFYLDARPLTGKLREFQPLLVLNVNKTDLEPVWDYMVRNYHYLGYDSMIGPRIKYLVLFKQQPPFRAGSHNSTDGRVADLVFYITKHIPSPSLNTPAFRFLPPAGR